MATLFERLSGNLLDLGLNNKLLNFKQSKLRSIEIIEPDSDELFSLVNDGNFIYFVPSPMEDIEEDPNNPYAIIEVKKPFYRKVNEAIAYKRKEKADYILKHLKKFNDSALVEKGINILYLAFGLLNWKQEEFSKNDLKSPLLLVPVSLEFDRKRQQYYLKRLEEEIVVNPSLKAKIALDFNVDLPEFLIDEDDVESYLAKVEEILPEDSWYVDNVIYLGIFSFAKITMYNDLKTNEKLMSRTPLIRAIYNGDDSGIDHHFRTDYHSFFYKGDDLNLYNVVDADSSQIEAILEAKNGKSFVIQGPPGTGKSQTITNIISELLHDGKKVLFVSEKKAALDVVYNNLKRVGLDDFSFQVHSDKMNKKEFVQELYRVLKLAKKSNYSRESKLNELKNKKTQLDSYAKTLYLNIPGLNIRIFDLINAVHFYNKYEHLSYKIPAIKSKSLSHLSSCQDVLEKYALFDGEEDPTKYLWYGFNSELYNYHNRDQIYEDLSQAFKFIGDTNYLINHIGEAYSIGYNTLEEAIEAFPTYQYLRDLPYIDKALCDRNFRIEIIHKLKELKERYTQKDLYKKRLNTVFNDDIFLMNIKYYKDLFLNTYKSGFKRLFNKQYRLDRDSLTVYLVEGAKPKYKTILQALLDADFYNFVLKKIDELINDIHKLTTYDYDLSNLSSVSIILKDISAFNDKHSIVNAAFDPDTRLDNLVILTNTLSTILTEENIKQYHKVQDYFMKKYVDFSNKHFDYLINKLGECASNMDALDEWVRFSSVFMPVENLNLSPFISYALSNGVSKEELKDAYAYFFYKEWMMTVYYETYILKNFRRTNQDLTVSQFQKLDKELLELDRKEIAVAIKNQLYDYISPLLEAGIGRASYSVDPLIKKEVSILEHEANKKRAIKPIRVMFKEIEHLLYKIKPCLLMSPLSVATYLAYNPHAFDVVIFDEASQIFPWDAIGSISRSESTIVVGDSKQMPPTNFFQVGASGDDDYSEEEEESINDYESILDLCTAVLPQKMLNWHYRSKTESLIAFSNHHFYHDRLVTFPSSQHDRDDFGIKFIYVKDGIYRNRENPKEAEQVIDLVYEHFRKHPERSLGVVCFSLNQQALLEDLLDERRRKDDSYAKCFDQTINEPFFIKNLETVQGDERDTIIFSIGYGKDPSGNLKHNFGPLNRKGGERRLNVAITRAKYNVQVVSSIQSFDIDLSRTKAEGARLLKAYLEMAESGVKVLRKDEVIEPTSEMDLALEKDVAKVIEEAGYHADIRVGNSNYLIDLCVKHPKNDDYVLAIECDGEIYHSFMNTRDRDRLRQHVLERLGWQYYRIWSTDWFINKEKEKKLLLERIEKAILDYDIALKEIEEKNKASLVERYKEIKEEMGEESAYPVFNEFLSNRNKFTDFLTSEQIKYIKAFNHELEKSQYGFLFDEREYVYSYKLRRDLSQGKKKAWFWFARENDKLVFKLRNDPDDIQPSYEVIIGEEGGLSSLVNYVFNEFRRRYVSGAPSIEEKPKEEEERVKDDRFFFLIAKAISGRRGFYKSSKESIIIDEVVEFVMNEIGRDVISKGYFKNREEFDKYKYHRRFTYTFFDISFSLGNISVSKAEEIYYYYIASKVIDKIKSYEKMYRTKILGNQRDFLNSLYQMIKLNDISFSKCDGLTSDFSLVPESVLEEEINKYLNIE